MTNRTTTHVVALGAAVLSLPRRRPGLPSNSLRRRRRRKRTEAPRQNSRNLLSATRRHPRLKSPGGHGRCRMRCRIIRQPCATTLRKPPASRDWGAFRCSRGREHSASPPRRRRRSTTCPMAGPFRAWTGVRASNADLCWPVVVGSDQRQGVGFSGAVCLAVVTERSFRKHLSFKFGASKSPGNRARSRFALEWGPAFRPALADAPRDFPWAAKSSLIGYGC
jgi:hypothetical protein